MSKITSHASKPLLLAAALTLGIAASARAQIGSGWVNYFDTHFIDYTKNGSHIHHDDSSFTDGGCYYDHTSNVRTFKILNSSCNRIEVQSDEHYTSGKRQMEGYVKISDISEQSIHQIFQNSSGPIIMIKGYNGNNGTLKKQGGSVVIATGVSGIYVRYNCINDISANSMKVYINGSLKWSGASAPGSSFNNKYGLYGTMVTSNPTVQWRDIKFFK